MTGIQIYNTCRLVVWLLLLSGGICGVIAGNNIHWLSIAGSLFFICLLFTDEEDGESLRTLLIRKLKSYKEARK